MPAKISTVNDANRDDNLPDSEDRVQDFLARHGGSAQRPERSEVEGSGLHGWSETYAADGYTLRCDWSRSGSLKEAAYSERPPARA